MTSETLQRLNEAGALTAGDLQRMFAFGKSTAYRVFSGERAITLDEASIIAQGARGPEVVLALVGVLIGGLPYVVTYLDEDLDINGDGQVDTRDLRAAATAELKGVADLFDEMGRAIDDGTISHTEGEHLLEQIGCCQRHLAAMARQVSLIRQPPRRKCRAVSPTGGKR